MRQLPQQDKAEGGNDVELTVLGIHTAAYKIYSLVINFIMLNYTMAFQIKAPDWLAGQSTHSVVKILQREPKNIKSKNESSHPNRA